MLVAGFGSRIRNPSKKETLAEMAKEGALPGSDMEGEISNLKYVKDISKQECTRRSGLNPRATSIDWMMKQLPRNYAGSLANLAWMQAVKNKPFNELFVKENFRSEERLTMPNRDIVEGKPSQKGFKLGKEVEDSVNARNDGCNVVEKLEEVEKEDGELEEGELVDTEVLEEPTPDSNAGAACIPGDGAKEKELERRINKIQKDLNTMTVIDVDEPFSDICSKICSMLESLQQLVLDHPGSLVSDLIAQAFIRIRPLHSLCMSVNLSEEKQNIEALSRVLSHIEHQGCCVFSSDQMKELQTMKKLLHPDSRETSARTVMEEQTVCADLEGSSKSSGSTAESVFPIEEAPENPSPGNVEKELEAVKLEEVYCSKGKGESGLLVNPLMDYDANSLPSPTREGPGSVAMQEFEVAGDETLVATTRQGLTVDNNGLQPYFTDAITAVSNYQQKFGRASFSMSDKLPSPTPSDECNHGEGDHDEEISSSVAVESGKGVKSTATPQVPMSATGASVCGLANQDKSSAPLSSELCTSTELSSSTRTSTRCRDPRLRNVSFGAVAAVLNCNECPHPVDGNNKNERAVLISRKHTATEEPVSDGLVKRQRNGLLESVISRDPQLSSTGGGWLEDNPVLGAQSRITEKSTHIQEFGGRLSDSGATSSNYRLDGHSFSMTNGASTERPGASSVPLAVSLPFLLKSIAENPTLFLQLKQSLEVGAQLKSTCTPQSSHTSINSSASSLPTFSENNVSSKPSDPGVPVNVLDQSSSANAPNKWGKIQMKRRDPRRALHKMMAQKGQTLAADYLKADGVQSQRDDMFVRGQNEQELACVLSHSPQAPDIAPEFTRKLKNIADILNPFLNTGMTKGISQVDTTTAVDSVDLQDRIGHVLAGGKPSPSQSWNPWGNVDYLFEGYDEQQKAAIQKERLRRIEEQNKMFTARKLSLVLDLDHTLLNSAKFVEVDPVHDEILRQKEEQDKEKSQRHLFRFPHMGMWTKLRPGVWTFLEKASLLYELHLYTMGNKLYATEMAKVLDPTGKLFAGRVISRGSDGSDPFDGDDRAPKSKDLDGVLGMESAVLIIDDSVRVWPHNKLNLILVERYTYFPCSRRQFGLVGPSLLEIDHDERPEDGTLASSLAVIEKIHHNFFMNTRLNEVDVRNILALEQRKILAGCCIVFSRIFPVGEAKPHLHPLWQTAEQFGAVCTTVIDDKVTHVVANSLGTDKVNWALSTGRFVVHPGWVEASALLYRRANEKEFTVQI